MFRYTLETEPISDREFEVQIGGSPVTLCIAANCLENDKPRIVLCSDWKAGSSLGSSQTANKVRWIKKNPNWIAMTSGNQRAIESLIRHYRKSLKNVNEFLEDEVEGVFGQIARAFLLKRKSDCVEQDIGVTYDYFRTHRDEWLPQIQLEIFTKVRKTDLEVSLLIVGWIDVRRGYPKPIICKISSDSTAAICSHFGAIGEGWMVATPSLTRREYDSDVSMKKAIYQLYEAKTLAEIVSSVGPDTSIDVFYPDRTIKGMTQPGYHYLDRKLPVYGPKPVVTRLPRFYGSFLEEEPISDLD